MATIEKAIRSANLGLNPTNDGKVVRIPLPALTEERRKELSKLVHKYAEEGRNGVRQVRRDANDRLKKLLKDHKISEDDERRGLDDVQKITDQHIALIDDLQKKKDSELLGAEVTQRVSYFTHLECSVPCGAGPLRSRASSSTSASAALPCSPATISTRRAPGRSPRWPAGAPTCGATAS